MIIEIKDLPEGRKVSRILVDISFEDSGTQEAHQDVSGSNNTRTKEIVIESPGVPTVDTVTISENVNTETRPAKQIPNEMLNVEF